MQWPGAPPQCNRPGSSTKNNPTGSIKCPQTEPGRSFRPGSKLFSPGWRLTEVAGSTDNHRVDHFCQKRDKTSTRRNPCLLAGDLVSFYASLVTGLVARFHPMPHWRPVDLETTKFDPVPFHVFLSDLMPLRPVWATQKIRVDKVPPNQTGLVKWSPKQGRFNGGNPAIVKCP